MTQDNRCPAKRIADKMYEDYKKELANIERLKQHEWLVKQYEYRNTYPGAKV